MDVIGAHARRLPPYDGRWTPGPYSDTELAHALLTGGVAGTATHPLDNVLGNIRMLLDGDPDKEFGLTGLQDGRDPDAVLRLVEAAAGSPIDRRARHGPVEIRPEPMLAELRTMGIRLARACLQGESVAFATGHPESIDYLLKAVGDLLADRGARVMRLGVGVSWHESGRNHDWQIDHWGAVAMQTDGRVPRHTHRPDAMEHMLAEGRPDLVVADHGFAGAAIQAGVETLALADVNDPALLIAKAQGRTEIVVVLDDHVPPVSYWPCFQAIAAEL
ncbi:MAG TPA: phosphatase [Actinomycetota bacterium]|nr:phosphatase [Actinomycetota bacterium]